ncbi:hypothetical protein AA0X95_04820 [Bacillus sp. 1P10SD]|uniref:hypothetical protein n=1 Tax=Bacillus sp. 1P10SD TaxID=3132265 RepID=UPI0039A4B106
MKRYWKIITLSIVTVLIIGTFYIQSSLAAEQNTTIDFEKVSGNEEEINDLLLSGDYVVGNLNQSLQITNKETINLTNQSFFQRLTRVNNGPIIKKLINQYRSFMRGKELNPAAFYEDEKLVAYANIIDPDSRDASIDVDFFNKKSEETTSIQLDVPKNETYSWMDVVDVQVIAGNLKVITRGFQTKGGSDLNVYTINIAEQKLVKNEVIYTTPPVENGGSDLFVMNDDNSIKPEKYLLLKLDVYGEQPAQDNGEMGSEAGPQVVSNEVMVYDLETNQLEKIGVPDEMLGSINNLAAVSQSSIYIPSQTAKGIEVNTYDIKNQKWGTKLTIEIVQNKNGESSPYMKLIYDKLYIIQATPTGHTIQIRDLKTGKSLYEGKLKVKNTNQGQKDYQLFINEIEKIQ